MRATVAGVGVALCTLGILFAEGARAQTCTKEQTLTGQVFTPSGAPVLRCDTEAVLRGRATALCSYTTGALGTFRVEAAGCAAGYARAVFTCCTSPARPVLKVPVPKVALPVPVRLIEPRRPIPRPVPAYASPIFQKPLNVPGRPLRGYVDLHAHLMNHLGFGGKLLYGGTDPGVTMPSGSIWRPACPTGWVMDSPGLCYSQCPDGYRGVGPSCYPLCPAGWTDAGLTCTPPTYGRGVGYTDLPSIYGKASQGRGAGYSWDPFAQRHNPEPPQGRNMSDGWDRCRYDHGDNGCDWGSVITYPKCPSGWDGVGPVCWQKCRAGYQDDGATCRRDGVDIARERCLNDNPQGCDQVVATFYPKCRAGYHTSGLLCQMDCPPTTTNTGLLCQKKLLARSGPQIMAAKTCNLGNLPAADMGDALGSCHATHGGWEPTSNTCGDLWRNFVVGIFADMAHHTVTHDGPAREDRPTFARWPKWNDVHHQLMWIDWVKRAYDGGLRVMVALAGNSMTLARVIGGNQPNDDKTTADVQIDEMHAYARRNSGFVEIARTAADLRRIVEADKLAIVIGLELDHLGGFGNNTPDPTADQVRAEIRRLHGKGARYVLPIHAANNPFGGTALYEPMFVFANLLQTGRAIDAVCADPSEKIALRIDQGDGMKAVFSVLGMVGAQPLPANCAANVGFKNARGLQPLGKVAIDEMMSLGMMIDVDHAGQNTTTDLVRYTSDDARMNSDLLKRTGGAYPLVTGHNGPRVAAPDSSERSLAEDHFAALAARGSICGVGSDSSEAGDWMDWARKVTALGMPIAFGSDVNGMANLPRPPWVNERVWNNTLTTAPKNPCKSAGKVGPADQCIEYLDDAGNKPSASSSATFKRAKTNTRTWDYNVEGVAHFGLFPDFLKDIERRGGQDVVTNMYDGAEKFAVSWARAEAIARRLAGGGK